MLYSELMKMGLEEVRDFVAENPNHVAGGNALRELEREHKNKKVLMRIGKKSSVVPGNTKARYSASMRRTPADKELR